MGIIQRIIIYFKLRKNYYSYFNKRKSELSIFKTLDINIDDKIQKTYNNLLKDKDLYHKAIDAYDSFLTTLKKHNNDVKKITEFFNAFNYETIIYNPLVIDINEYNNIKLLVKRYNLKGTEIECKIDNFNEIINNYKLIVEQYEYHEEYKNLFKFEDKYLETIVANEIINRARIIYNKISNYKKLYYDYNILDMAEECVFRHNEMFVNRHKKDKLFDNINGKSLDDDQRSAVLRDDISALTIAGAGSGKTLTICGKVKYLIEKLNVLPEDILLLSYSKKSADDLSKKVHSINEKLTVGTFHKLGLEILSTINNKKLIVEEQFDAIVEKYFREVLPHDITMATKVLNYYSLYLSYAETKDKYNNKNELYSDLKKNDYITLKDVLASLSLNKDERITIKKERVKSNEELAIANYYFINGINYTYEKPYKYDVSSIDIRQYKPDFYLNDYDIYHEHYGINKEGKASQFGEQEAIKYVETMEWKRNTHKEKETTCLETYSYEFSDNTIFDNLEKQLKENGVEFKPLTSDEVNNALNSIYLEHQFSSLINIIKTFISLYKSRYSDNTYFDLLDDDSNKSKDVFYNHKTKMFLEICKHIYDYYINTIRKENKIDFDDMILQATNGITLLDKYRYKYIIVDEFQDISYSRMKFLKAIIKHGNSRLFAVGDDYQAIYRFSGCDLDIFINFDKYFGLYTKNIINATHRNSQELQDIVNPFIIKNKEQIVKNIHSDKSLNDPIQIMYYNDNKYDAFISILGKISAIDKKANVLVLGRMNKDIDSILSNRIYNDNHNKKHLISIDYPDLNLNYSTVHASKGLEEDYVILINADSALLGFPNRIEDDPILSLVLSNKSEYPYAEERRLFYVALTRTKLYTFIIASAEHPSEFIDEIKDKCKVINSEALKEDMNPRKCPKCGGRLVIRQNGKDKHTFFGCSNYPYCDYTNENKDAVLNDVKCPECGDYLEVKYGRYGKFYGCHNYPRCKYHRKIEK